jgi:hypothetical protein
MGLGGVRNAYIHSAHAQGNGNQAWQRHLSSAVDCPRGAMVLPRSRSSSSAPSCCAALKTARYTGCSVERSHTLAKSTPRGSYECKLLTKMPYSKSGAGMISSNGHCRGEHHARLCRRTLGQLSKSRPFTFSRISGVIPSSASSRSVSVGCSETALRLRQESTRFY